MKDIFDDFKMVLMVNEDLNWVVEFPMKNKIFEKNSNTYRARARNMIRRV